MKLCLLATVIHTTLIGMGVLFYQRKQLEGKVVPTDFKCPAGTFMYKDQGLFENELIEVGLLARPKGFRGGQQEGPISCGKCQAGFSCEGEFAVPCAQHHFSGKQGKCEPCREGEFQDLLGSSSCAKCPKGSKCPQKGRGKQECSEGYFQTKQGQTVCDPCPKGHSCQSPIAEPKKCKQGHFQDKEAQGACK